MLAGTAEVITESPSISPHSLNDLLDVYIVDQSSAVSAFTISSMKMHGGCKYSMAYSGYFSMAKNG
jgi:hypothetical protein